MTIVLRNVKGTPLTHGELDGNFTDVDGRILDVDGEVLDLEVRVTTLETEISVDGVLWESQVNPVDNDWEEVVYGNGLYVAVSGTGTGDRVMTSPDGVNWTTRTSAADNPWTGLAYGDGIFVAVAKSGGQRVMTSYDGITWTIRTPPISSNWSSVTYGNGLFVAVSSQSTLNDCMTSPDGITWTAQTLPRAQVWQSVTYGNGLYVAVSSTGAGERVMTSPDGINWTTRVSAADVTWLDVVYGNGLYVATSAAGSGNIFMTSPDGITWSTQTVPINSTWFDIEYANGVFVAVGLDGVGGNKNVMTSPDSILWTLQDGVAPNTWKGITYGNGMFVAVAATGTGDRVMTSGFTHETITEDTHRINGSLGINTTPSRLLEVDGVESIIRLTSTAASAKTWEFVSGGGITTGAGIFAVRNATDSNMPFRIQTLAATDTLFVSSLSRIGINTNNPDGKLHVHTASAGVVTANSIADDLVVEGSVNTGISILTPDAITGYFVFGSPSDTLGAYLAWNHTNNQLLISSQVVGAEVIIGSGDGTPAITIDSSQNVGIGISTPDGRLHVHTATAGAITASVSADDLIVENSASGGISILSPDASNSNLFFGSPTHDNGGFLSWQYNSGEFQIGTNKAAAFITLNSGSNVEAIRIASDQGAYMTGATGGSQGSGTFNAQAVYDDGVLLTCYVPHYIVDGGISLNEWDDLVPNKKDEKTFHLPARRFALDVHNRIEVEKFTDFWKTNKHLPTMPSKEEWVKDGPKPTGEMIQMLWETVELQAAHIDQLLIRIEALEKVA